jgi:hypothetical protein
MMDCFEGAVRLFWTGVAVGVLAVFVSFLIAVLVGKFVDQGMNGGGPK